MALDELFLGLAGRPLEQAQFDLGEGLCISQTYAHIMAPMMAAFSPALPGKPHPTPYRALSGGIGFDILCEIKVPHDTAARYGAEEFTLAWIVTALLRLKNGPGIVAPASSRVSFSDMLSTTEEPAILPIEIEPRLLGVAREFADVITVVDLCWVREYWNTAVRLINDDGQFVLALAAYDQCTFLRSVPLALLSLWSAFEALFAPGRDELRFRMSTTIACILEPPGKNRLTLQRSVAKLYDSRSAAAHGRADKLEEPLIESYSLMRRVLMRILEQGHGYSQEEISALVFGVEDL